MDNSLKTRLQRITDLWSEIQAREAELMSLMGIEVGAEEKPKRRGRPTSPTSSARPPEDQAPKKRRGRPPKLSIAGIPVEVKKKIPGWKCVQCLQVELITDKPEECKDCHGKHFMPI